MKEIMLSIKPRWCVLIASGEKMIEIRKVKPDTELPFKCYIYCSSERNRTIKQAYEKGWTGSVIGEFICNEIRDSEDIPGEELFKLSCMSYEDWDKYTAGHKGKVWGWNISELKMYDKPKKLREFRNLKVKGSESEHIRMSRPPQSYSYVERFFEDVKKENKSPAQRRWEKINWKELSAECARLHISYGECQQMYYSDTLPEDFGLMGKKISQKGDCPQNEKI